MDAIQEGDGGSQLIDGRCIGCGLCVSTCPTKALCLVRKPREVQPLVPSTVAASMLRLAWKRRQTGPLALLRLLAGSQKDRLRVKVKGRGR
jgi:Fe-S-cluster-containing hydrogenase component 2